jgi:hypothetical protein
MLSPTVYAKHGVRACVCLFPDLNWYRPLLLQNTLLTPPVHVCLCLSVVHTVRVDSDLPTGEAQPCADDVHQVIHNGQISRHKGKCHSAQACCFLKAAARQRMGSAW